MADRRNYSRRDALLRRIGGEFTEMPCLRLTGPQARRLFDLRADICERILAALAAEGLLICDGNGRYRLNDARHWPPHCPLPVGPYEQRLAYHASL